jgi:hypothetical protein
MRTGLEISDQARMRLVFAMGLYSPALPLATLTVNTLLVLQDDDLRFKVLHRAILFQHHRIVTSHLGTRGIAIVLQTNLCCS